MKVPTMRTGRVMGLLALGATTVTSLIAVAPPAGAAGATVPFSVGLTQSCTAAGINSGLTEVITGRVPKTVKHGSAFALTGLSLTATFDASLTSLAAAFGVQTASASVSQMLFSISNARPSSVNAVPAGTTVGSGNIPVVGGQPANVRIPQQGSLTARGLTAGGPGSMTVTFGALTASLTAAPWLNNSPLTCQPASTPLVTIHVK